VIWKDVLCIVGAVDELGCISATAQQSLTSLVSLKDGGLELGGGCGCVKAQRRWGWAGPMVASCRIGGEEIRSKWDVVRWKKWRKGL